MSQNALITALAELADLEQLKAELDAQIEGVKDQIKAHMTDTEQETLTAGCWAISYKPVTSTRIDTAALRRDLPEVWTEYGKTSTVKRFTVNMAK